MPTVSWSGNWWLLSEENVRRFVPTSAGVYVLRDRGERKSVVYVGQAENLEQRLLQHLAPNEPNKCIRDRARSGLEMRWALVALQSDRDCIERALYDHYNKPVCNEKTPPGAPCAVNFPD